MTLVSVTAYHSFGGEVEASNTPTIRRLTPSCRHQLPRIAPARSHNRSPRLARRSTGDAAAEHTLVPTKQLPLPVHECPGQRKAHKALPKTSITRFATKSGEARDVACL